MKLIRFFSKLFNNTEAKTVEWDDTLHIIAKTEKTENLTFPVLLIDNDVTWDFTPYFKSEDIINDSIFSHWSGVVPNDIQLNANVVDTNGNVLQIKNDCFNKDLKISYSFPDNSIGKMSTVNFKEKIIYGYKEYIELFEPNYKSAILKGIELINASKSIYEIILIIHEKLNHDELKTLDTTV
jgi:hypothetical protein